jgi:hypothetical protein
VVVKAQGEGEQDITLTREGVVQTYAKVVLLAPELSRIRMAIAADEATLDIRNRAPSISADASTTRLDQVFASENR